MMREYVNLKLRVDSYPILKSDINISLFYLEIFRRLAMKSSRWFFSNDDNYYNFHN